MKHLLLTCFTVAYAASLSAQNIDSLVNPMDEMKIKNVIQNFLTAAGDYDTDAISTFFTSNANISGASLRNDTWKKYTMTIQEFTATLKANAEPKKYKEPVANWTIHIESGQLAFVRLDATVISDGQKKSHNIDYFTLIKDSTEWKILNGSYVSLPIIQKSVK